MRKNLSINKLIVFVAFATAMAACKKTETINVQEPTACFSITVPDFTGMYLTTGDVTFIDSNFTFKNCSDSGVNITYQWDFGDGTSSSEKNPKHKYSKRGTYAVTLTVSNNNMAYDTVRRNVSVVLGQQHISFGDGVNVYPVGIEETMNNEFVLLSFSGFNPVYQLIQMDSLMKQKSVKTFPANHRYTSLASTTDGNFILTGSTQAADKSNEIVKMKADGTQLWNKVLSSNDAYSYVSQAPDGGYVVVGSRPTPGPFGNSYLYTVIIKTDNNGNQQWEKVLGQEGMLRTRNAIVEQTGIVVAGVKYNTTGACSDCDSAFILRLSNAGTIEWKTSVLWGFNTNNWWDTRIAKLPNGNYAVSNEYTRGIFFFSPTGDFADRKIMNHQVTEVMGSADGHYIVMMNESGNGFRIGVQKLTLSGALQWHTYPEGRLRTPGGYMCCTDSRPITMRRLRNGGTLILGYRVINNATGFGVHTNALLIQLDDAGKIK